MTTPADHFNQQRRRIISSRRGGYDGRKGFYMYGTRQERDKKAMEQAAFLRDCAGLFPALRRVFYEFDGKVFNCKLEKALREATGWHLTAAKRFKWLEVSIYKDGCQRTLAQIELANLVDEKRIPAALLIESAREKREKMLTEAADIEKSMQQVDLVKQQIDYLTKQINAVMNTLPYSVRDIYNLHYCVRNS